MHFSFDKKYFDSVFYSLFSFDSVFYALFSFDSVFYALFSFDSVIYAPRDLKFGTLIHLHERAKIPPVLIQLPVWCVFYGPESKISLISIFTGQHEQIALYFVKISGFIRIYDF